VRDPRSGSFGVNAKSALSSDPHLPLVVFELEQLLERPSRPTPRAGPAWPARIYKQEPLSQMKEVKVYVGLDLAKAYLDLAWTTQRKRLCNAAAGRSQLLKWLGPIASQVDVICEASGGYERAVIQALQRRGIDVSLVQANRVRQFARAAAILAKTNRIEAAVLASLGTALSPAPTQAQPLSPSRTDVIWMRSAAT